MRWSLKIIIISVLAFFSIQGFAWTNDYVSAFKPAKKTRSFSELQKDLKKDIFQIRSIMKSQKKKITGIIKKSDKRSKRTPAEI